MRQTVLFILLLRISTLTFCQKFDTLYYNPYWYLTTKSYSEFYRVASIDTANYKFTGVVKDYYKNGNLQMVGAYRSNNKNGTFNFYYPSGKIKTTGYYKDNIRWGIWTDYYENGRLKEKIVFNDIFLSVLEYYDENGNPKVLNGTGDWSTNYFNDFGLSYVKITGSFKDSLRNGTWQYYTDYIASDNESEKYPLVEIYENGKFISGEELGSDGKVVKRNISTIHVLPETTKFEKTEKWQASIYASRDEYPFLKFLPKVDSSYFPVNTLASFSGGLDSLRAQIARQIKLKKSYIKSQAHRFCLFKIIIDEQGTLKIEEDPNISIIKMYPTEAIFYNQALQALKNLPKWEPAIRANKHVGCHFTLYIILDNGLVSIKLSSTNQLIQNPDLKLISKL